ncbi:MAG: hypothetical protein CL880_03040 [Dehalococcoidia bacterium]|nr:hypothetical protein [Dehalococcoidia bacterium]|tara:strand:- start:402 stop:1502 length:1101 start_codon:yes stop_codon:yes gene_type:complete
MKITDVKYKSYRWPLTTPIRNGKHIYPEAGLNIIQIDTDENISGIGLIGGVHNSEEMFAAITSHFKETLIGQSPFNTERIFYDLWQPKIIGRRGMTTRVISGIDIALWDIKGKYTNLPLYKLIGGQFNKKIPVYVAGGYYEKGKGLKELADEMINNISSGVTAVKMKIGGASIIEDVERVKTARSAIGPNIKLLVDANCAYNCYEAIDLARKIENYNIFWFEEPLPPDDYEGYKKLSQSTVIPIATGENEYTKYGFRDLIKNRCASILQPDALTMGGISEFLKTAYLAQTENLPISPHGNQDVHIHLISSISNGLLLEYYNGSTDPMWLDMFEEPLKIQDGHAVAPERPGLGINLNHSAISKYQTN